MFFRPIWCILIIYRHHNVRCLSIISMHQMDQKLLFYLMLMTVSIDNSCIQNLRIGYLWSWTVDTQTIYIIFKITVKEPCYYWSICMEWPNMESYLLISWQSGCLRQASFSFNVICLYIIIMQHMEQKLLFYLMLMTVSISIFLNILGNGL